MRVLLDTNILLDILLQRQPWLADAQVIEQASLSGRLETCVTSTSVTDLFYIGRRLAGKELARRGVQMCIDQMTILRVDAGTITRAQGFDQRDFEDAVQIVSALEADVDAIVTRDTSGFRDSPVTVLSPQQLATQLSNEI